MRFFISTALLAILTSLAPAEPDGREIYARTCASCHGENGEGVDDEYDEPLWGSRSLESLTRYIHKWMPEDEEETVVDDDAAAVSKFIHDAFYSPEAQARNNPSRIRLTRLTAGQYRSSVADLAGSFLSPPRLVSERGLKARYYNAEKMNMQKKQVLERVDPVVDFDFGTAAPVDGATQQGFSIRWTGSLLASETGLHEFRLRTRNGARLALNSFVGNIGNEAFLDAWVSSGNEEREVAGRMFLLGGRAYPLELQFFSYQEKNSAIHLEWKPPHGVWEPIPNDYLLPQSVPPVLVVDTPFPADDRSEGYERGTALSKQWHEATTHAAIDAANTIVTHLGRIARIRDGQRKDAEKLRAFCARFAERAFRRPLSGDERDLFVDRLFREQEDPEVATKHCLLLVLNSPRFLYPGLVENDGAPDDFTLASRLALALTDSLPDSPLREAAAKGELRDPKRLASHARRLMDDPRTRFKMQQFFYHWLALEEREDLGKDPKLFPGFDQRLVTDLRRSLHHFIDDIVWDKSSDYRQLLLAEDLFLNPRLAEFYGASLPEETKGFVKSAAPDRQRAGVFTQPYLLSAFAYHDNTSPIHRGVFLSRNVLGRLLKPPPEATIFNSGDFDPNLTMREKVTDLTKDATCMQCHQVINPVGFSLEYYDAVGRFRTTEKNKPINTVSDYVTARDEKLRISEPRDLARLAIGSETAHRAFITHLFHHLVKQPIDAYGPRTLDEHRREFVDSEFHIQKLLVRIAETAAYHAEDPGRNARVHSPAPPKS